MTRNPWKLDQGSSGSSAGPAAATAAGLVAFSIGSETLGSISSPSTRCGVTGLRPTYGRVSRHGAMALSWSMDKIGPMCRTVEDCALVLSAIYGPDQRDPTVKDVAFNWDARLPLGSLRIGYYKSAFEQTNQPGERNTFDQAALEVMRRLVPNLIEVELPATRDFPIGAIGSSILSIEAAAAFDELTRGEADNLMVPEPERSTWPATFRAARLVPAVEYINANRARTLLMQKMHEALKAVDVLFMPNTALQLTNLTGHPQIALPAGFNTNGTPVTICFLAQLYAEDKLLRVAQAWQDATDHHLKYPPLFSV